MARGAVMVGAANGMSAAINDDWKQILNFAKKSDYRSLLHTLINEAMGTEFEEQSQEITEDWLHNIRQRYRNEKTTKEIEAVIKRFNPHLGFILSLPPIRKMLMFELLFDETTISILTSENADDIYVVTNDPSTSNIYRYTSIYTDALSADDNYFRFMVHGENEVDEEGYRRITKGDLNAFSR